MLCAVRQYSTLVCRLTVRRQTMSGKRSRYQGRCELSAHDQPNHEGAKAKTFVHMQRENRHGKANNEKTN